MLLQFTSHFSSPGFRWDCCDQNDHVNFLVFLRLEYYQKSRFNGFYIFKLTHRIEYYISAHLAIVSLWCFLLLRSLVHW
jgi:hypothetical protein